MKNFPDWGAAHDEEVVKGKKATMATEEKTPPTTLGGRRHGRMSSMRLALRRRRNHALGVNQASGALGEGGHVPRDWFLQGLLESGKSSVQEHRGLEKEGERGNSPRKPCKENPLQPLRCGRLRD